MKHLAITEIISLSFEAHSLISLKPWHLDETKDITINLSESASQSWHRLSAYVRNPPRWWKHCNLSTPKLRGLLCYRLKCIREYVHVYLNVHFYTCLYAHTHVPAFHHSSKVHLSFLLCEVWADLCLSQVYFIFFCIFSFRCIIVCFLQSLKKKLTKWKKEKIFLFVANSSWYKGRTIGQTHKQQSSWLINTN